MVLGRRLEHVHVAVHGGDQQVGAAVVVQVVRQHHAVAGLPDVDHISTPWWPRFPSI